MPRRGGSPTIRPHWRKSLENQALVYFSGITLAILDAAARAALLAAARPRRGAAGSLIAFDPNYRPRLWPRREDAHAAIVEALAVTDIALPTFPDEQVLFGDAATAGDRRRGSGKLASARSSSRMARRRR